MNGQPWKSFLLFHLVASEKALLHGRVSPYGQKPAERVASFHKVMANELPPLIKGSRMHLLFTPALGAFYYIGGGAGLLIVIVIVVLLLRR
jgi:hypothetical protein